MIRAEIIGPGADNPLARLAARMPDKLKQAMGDALARGLDSARAAMSPGGSGPRRRSGRLAGSLRASVTEDGKDLLGRLSASAPYAAAQEYGAVIQAKRAAYLKFKVSGRWVQVKKVVLPARPFLGPAAHDATRELEGLVLRALMEE